MRRMSLGWACRGRGDATMAPCIAWDRTLCRTPFLPQRSTLVCSALLFRRSPAPCAAPQPAHLGTHNPERPGTSVGAEQARHQLFHQRQHRVRRAPTPPANAEPPTRAKSGQKRVRAHNVILREGALHRARGQCASSPVHCQDASPDAGGHWRYQCARGRRESHRGSPGCPDSASLGLSGCTTSFSNDFGQSIENNKPEKQTPLLEPRE